MFYSVWNTSEELKGLLYTKLYFINISYVQPVFGNWCPVGSKQTELDNIASFVVTSFQ